MVNRIEKKGYGDLVEQMKIGLKRYGMTLDFEAIYSILEGLTRLEHSIRDAGPFTSYVGKDLKNYYQNDLKDMLKFLKDFIWKECKLKRRYDEQITRVYDRLFFLAKESRFWDQRFVPNRERQTSSLVNVGNTIETQVDVGKTIATTNYDNIIEIYHRIKRQNYVDGFRRSEDPARSYLDFSSFSERPHDRWLIKLHGSLYQYKFEDTIFKTIEEPKKLSTKIAVQENMMIYPTQEKSMLKYPYHNFYDIFKAQEWMKLIAIGYSFRDVPVNIAIIENLEKVQHSNLIVVNPHPETVLQNLGVPALSKFDDRIITINSKFGDERVFVQLKIALKVESKLRFQVRLKEKRDELQKLIGHGPED